MTKNILDTPVEELPIRAEGIRELKEKGLYTLRDVIQLSERGIRKFRGIGNSTIARLEVYLEKHGLSWGTIDNALYFAKPDPTPEPTATPDNDLWEHRRYELAKAALIGLSGKAMKAEVAAVEAVVYADAVIKELRHED